jgi:uncharacterized protein YjbI with pentapeptide repeats
MCCRVLSIAALIVQSVSVNADIYRWDNGQVIPGTEGITPGQNIDLSLWNGDSHNLRYADFSGDLSFSNFFNSWVDNARFINANLTGASLSNSTLTNANLTAANLTNAELGSSTLTIANLTGAVVTGTSFYDTTSRGFTAAQLYSTGSYQARDLQGI